MAETNSFTRNPFGAAVSFTKSKDVGTKALMVEAHLGLADPERGEMPQEVFAGYSRFHFVLNGYGTPIVAKVTPQEMAYIIKKSANYDLINDQMSLQEKNTSVPGTPAYTVRFASGNLKGKTPAQILTDEGDRGREILKEQYIFLRHNLSKYPANQQVMDAIAEAMNLHEKGQLNTEAAAGTGAAGTRDIFISGPRGNSRKQRSDGMSPCFETELRYVFGDKPVVEVSLCNYYAPIKIFEGGSQNVQKSQMDKNTLLSGKFFTPADDWNWFMDRAQAAMMRFDMLHSREIENNVKRAYEYNVQKAKEMPPSA